MAASKYEPFWQQLKVAEYDGMSLNLNFPREETRKGRKLTTEEKDKLFLRVRKALSHRKSIDYEYQVDEPSAKIIVSNKDYEQGIITFCIRYQAGDVTISDLKM